MVIKSSTLSLACCYPFRGQIISDLRHRLSVENTEMLTFLTVNLPKIEQVMELPVDISELNYREEQNWTYVQMIWGSDLE